MGFVATADRERAKSFYGGVLGLPLVSDDQFASVFDSSGTLVRVVGVEKPTIAPYTVLGWQVDDIQKTVAGLAQKGVEFMRYPFLEQDANAIWTAPGGARVAWFKDPDGNLLSVSQH
jgi:catechol 2,3-dioxygenase-like lactoylglutathione lyase family enzyme